MLAARRPIPDQIVATTSMAASTAAIRMKGRLESNTRGSLILFADLANDTEQRISLLGDEPQKRFLEARLLFLVAFGAFGCPLLNA